MITDHTDLQRQANTAPSAWPESTAERYREGNWADRPNRPPWNTAAPTAEGRGGGSDGSRLRGGIMLCYCWSLKFQLSAQTHGEDSFSYCRVSLVNGNGEALRIGHVKILTTYYS